MKIHAWWFSKELKLPHGDGRPIAVGVTHTHDGVLKLCDSGLHSSRRIIDALSYASGPILCHTLCEGEIVEADDKLVCSERTYLAVVDATEMLDYFARMFALDVAHLWDMPTVVKEFLRRGDESLRAAAQDAAWAAPVAAPATAAAARSAAWAADTTGATAANARRSAAWAADAVEAVAGAIPSRLEVAVCVTARLILQEPSPSAARAAARANQNRRLQHMAMDLIRTRTRSSPKITTSPPSVSRVTGPAE